MQRDLFSKQYLLLLVIGILFYSTYTFSIFDIYYKSPIIHGMKLHEPDTNPLAERVVLIVADGLRADKLFERENQNTTQTRAKFLQQKLEEEGNWGISHSRVPTESRPGHVALIAGFYEDVSAVTKGWKSNPVEFDSSFHRADQVYCFGSPDIVYLFNNDLEGSENIFSWSYSEEEEDFGVEGSHLDTWVFQQFRYFLLDDPMFMKNNIHSNENKNNRKSIRNRLDNGKTIIFLHLLGIDTNGHSHRPNSKEYLDNINVIDSGIEQIYHLIENYFNDNKTAYVFTSDHGMSDIGNHGDGNPVNTQTPLILWGSGISKAQKINENEQYKHIILGEVDETQFDWPVSKSLQRRDINQADIAPLIGALLGSEYAKNSIGVLPIDFLDTSYENKAKLLLRNALQILEQVFRQSILFEQSKLFYISYDQTLIRNISQNVTRLIENKQFNEAIEQCYLLIDEAIQAMTYYQKYDRFFLIFIVVFGFFGWFSLLCLNIFSDEFPNTSNTLNNQNYIINITKKSKFSHFIMKNIGVSRITFAGIFLLISIKFIIEKSPLLYFAYLFFPCLFWSQIFYSFDRFIYLIKLFRNSFIYCIFIVLLMEILVYSFFERKILSICIVIIGIWSILHHKNRSSIYFFITTLIIAIFPLLPIDHPENSNYLYLASFLILLFSIIEILQKSPSFFPRFSIVFLCIILTNISIYFTTSYRTSLNGLPSLLQNLNLILFVVGLVLPFFSKGPRDCRLQSIFLSFSITFTILSVHYEALYYWSLGMSIKRWLDMEEENMHSQESKRSRVFRVAIFYMVLFFIAFFGMGNIASIGSFEISSTYRLLTKFRPFVMTALLLIKIFIPFILVSCYFIAVNRTIKISEANSFLFVILMCGIIALNFFFLVQEEGSWKDIGMSISHYIVASAFIILQLGLYFVSLFYLRNVEFKKIKDTKSRQ